MTEVPEDRLRDLSRGGEEMEEQLGELQGDIDEAHTRAAEHRERADPEAAARDREDASAATQQGEDAESAIADAPVHEATQVTPGAAEGGGQDDEAGGDEGEGIADAPVHEAREVTPGEGGADDDS